MQAGDDAMQQNISTKQAADIEKQYAKIAAAQEKPMARKPPRITPEQRDQKRRLQRRKPLRRLLKSTPRRRQAKEREMPAALAVPVTVPSGQAPLLAFLANGLKKHRVQRTDLQRHLLALRSLTSPWARCRQDGRFRARHLPALKGAAATAAAHWSMHWAAR